MYGLASIVGVLFGTIWDIAANQGVTVKAAGRIGMHLMHQAGILF